MYYIAVESLAVMHFRLASSAYLLGICREDEAEEKEEEEEEDDEEKGIEFPGRLGGA